MLIYEYASHDKYHGEKTSLGRALWRVVGFAILTIIREPSLITGHLSRDLQDWWSQALRYLQKLGSRQREEPVQSPAKGTFRTLAQARQEAECPGVGGLYALSPAAPKPWAQVSS